MFDAAGSDLSSDFKKLDIRLSKRIQYRNYKRSEDSDLDIRGLCMLVNCSLLLACGYQGLREIETNNDISPNEQCNILIKDRVHRVNYDLSTNTLLVVVWNSQKLNGYIWWIVSYTRDSNSEEWNKMEEHPIEKIAQGYLSDMALCDSKVLIGKENGNELYTFSVNYMHKIRYDKTITLKNKLRAFACTKLDDETLIAFSHELSVSLYRLVDSRLEPLSNVLIGDTLGLAFRGNMLIATHMNKSTENREIVSLTVSKGQLTSQRTLLVPDRDIQIDNMIVTEERLVVVDLKSNDLLVYTFESSRAEHI